MGDGCGVPVVERLLRVIGPDTDLRLSVAGCVFGNRDGRINMPDGEIASAPIEDSIEGYMSFSYPALFTGCEVTGVYLLPILIPRPNVGASDHRLYRRLFHPVFGRIAPPNKVRSLDVCLKGCLVPVDFVKPYAVRIVGILDDIEA
jgi:hypothetical protein